MIRLGPGVAVPRQKRGAIGHTERVSRIPPRSADFLLIPDLDTLRCSARRQRRERNTHSHTHTQREALAPKWTITSSAHRSQGKKERSKGGGERKAGQSMERVEGEEEGGKEGGRQAARG